MLAPFEVVLKTCIAFLFHDDFNFCAYIFDSSGISSKMRRIARFLQYLAIPKHYMA